MQPLQSDWFYLIIAVFFLYLVQRHSEAATADCEIICEHIFRNSNINDSDFLLYSIQCSSSNLLPMSVLISPQDYEKDEC